MITLDNGYIRMAEPDDARTLWWLYFDGNPRAGLLDNRREPLIPTVDELRELLGRHEAAMGNLFAIENNVGEVAGFCNLRGMTQDTGFGDLAVMFHSDNTFQTTLADSVMHFVFERSFEKSQRKRIYASILSCESCLRDFLIRHGFESNGVQREVIYARGTWLDIESLSLDSPI